MEKGDMRETNLGTKGRALADEEDQLESSQQKGTLLAPMVQHLHSQLLCAYVQNLGVVLHDIGSSIGGTSDVNKDRVMIHALSLTRAKQGTKELDGDYEEEEEDEEGNEVHDSHKQSDEGTKELDEDKEAEVHDSHKQRDEGSKNIDEDKDGDVHDGHKRSDKGSKNIDEDKEEEVEKEGEVDDSHKQSDKKHKSKAKKETTELYEEEEEEEEEEVHHSHKHSDKKHKSKSTDVDHAVREFTMEDPATIFVMGTFFGFHTYLHEAHLFNYTKQCKVPCRFITRFNPKEKKCVTHAPRDDTRIPYGDCENALEEADIVLRHKQWRYLSAAEPHKEGQKTAFLTIESGHYAPDLWDNRRLGQIEMTFRKKADIRVNYFSNEFRSIPDLYHKVSHSLVNKAKVGGDMALATAFISNCIKHRADYVQRMEKAGMSVDMYGLCDVLRNKDENKDIKKYAKGGRMKKADRKQFLSSMHKFILAFENRQVDDYVTEKFFQALVSGALPIYRGAPNIKEYVPNLDYPSFINADAFETPEDLVKYMNKVVANQTLYDSYFEWKKKPFRKEFLDLFTWSRDTIPCRICEYAQKQYDVQGKRYLIDGRDLAEEALVHYMQETDDKHAWKAQEGYN
ncbi:hypothetical protein SARC_05442 [Sphaeroforma arctica JP610]|uniref:Fucosyltransferase n=1 Tax=Sphaeroforma arctica JP610 TaxID=667725 RepID=A0A0L0FZM1_9EUKA|nr:hypothetical protein SARC_05442 [Sphaeroforma arctica JP610]KNC82270.1 hypothetical protein SARC_05442 [Sphaeroforma arctica JP610]|eukprot:XP_014156172.1 hypothetical protein SARC_05442 [Sphaeroforma arctica JP610]